MVGEKRLLTLFLTTLKISAFTFGGGYVIIPLMRSTFVNKLKWIEESEMLDLTAIAQSTPGAIAVNAAIITGFKVRGILGALVALLGTIIPPFFTISIISVFYNAFRDNKYVTLAMSAMSAGVAAVVIDVVISMTYDLLKKKRLLPILMLLISFILLEFAGLNIIYMVLIAGIVGYLDYRYIGRRI